MAARKVIKAEAGAPPIRQSDETSGQIDTMSLASIGAYMFFDDIDSETAKPLCEFIIKSNYMLTCPLTIFINSAGGSVYDGWSIVDIMGSSKLKIQTVGVGLIASMAAVVLAAGTKGMRVMTPNAYVMTHQFSEGLEGKFHELVAHREHQDDLHEKFVSFFIKNTKLNAKQVSDILLSPTDKMLSPKECLKYGLCDLIKNPWE
jgi:ATP-dependent Clp endopeptidase proteolytic subunit ClpP